MKTYTFIREQIIQAPVKEAWSFFSDPGNLARITPGDLNFKIRSGNLPSKIYPGMRIEYSLSPLPGMKVHWITEIKDVLEPLTFTDVQLKGPYKLWVHKHSFSEHPGGTKMKDVVEYALPFSYFGRFALGALIRKKLTSIFDYREKAISKLFNSAV